VVYHIRDWEKESPESIDIHICDPANPEIPIEVTGSGKVNSHMCISVSMYRASGVEKTSYEDELIGITSRKIVIA